MVNSLQTAVLQFPVSMDAGRNLERLTACIDQLDAGTLAVAPEGALSGYAPEPGFVASLDPGAIARAIDSARSTVANKKIHLVVGACFLDDGAWKNSSFYIGPEGRLERYDKINLAQSERGTFHPGNRLPVFEIDHEGEAFHLGIQMCREIRYPEQWRVLAAKGAQVIAYVNNAVGSRDGDHVWRAHMISRAAETQRFILGANNAASDQKCPSMIVSPSGKVLAEIAIGSEGKAEATLVLSEVSDWVLSQARDDVVAVLPRE
jgi:predicted amidohydrolase